MKKKLHLALFGVSGPDPDAWASEEADLYDWRSPDKLMDIARLAERAKLDLMFFADSPAMSTTYRNSLEFAAKSATLVTADPMIMISVLSAVTKKIGLGATCSTTFIPPYLMARQLNSLDNLSGGRAAWNVVTTSVAASAAVFGAKFPDHDLRYDMADEHLEICRRLWDSWAPDAVVNDRVNRTFADYTKITPVDFEGKYHSCKGPLNFPSSPQRHPVIINAGVSPRGQKFAVDHADVVISHKKTAADMKTYTTQLREQLVNAGRDPYSCKVFFALRPWIGDSEQEAHEKMLRARERADLEHGLGYLSMNLGADLSTFDLDEPLSPDMKVNAIQGTLLKYTQAMKGITLREAALMESVGDNFPIYGTASQIADQIEAVAAESDADGFHFRNVIQNLSYVVDLTTKLVPELRRRGLFRNEYTGSTLRDHLFGPQI